MITFAEILADYSFDLSRVLKDCEKYFAHTNASRKETLAEHTKLTLDYFKKLCDANRLEPVIDHLIEAVLRLNVSNPSNQVYDLVKRMFVESVYFHDFGKVNENFQVEKMENNAFSRVQNGIRSEHSILSAVLFLAVQLRRIDQARFTDEENNWLCLLAYLFSYPIVRHHGQMISPLDYEFDSAVVPRLSRYLALLQTVSASRIEHVVRLSQWRYSSNPMEPTFDNLLRGIKEPFALFALLRLNSSLLTAADYYATNQFMVGIECSDFGVFDDRIKAKAITSLWSVAYNSDLREKEHKYHQLSFESVQTKSAHHLNILRAKLAAEVLSVFREKSDKQLFYIEAPTGSGKTNLSLLILGELLKHKKETTKVFYVFPFTTLITQTYETIRTSFGLDNHEVAAVHSKAPFYARHDHQEDDTGYGIKRKNYIDNLFVNYPICLVSHVRFFDMLLSNEKDLAYLFHRIPNSIVVIDEIQAYPPTEWDKVNYLLQNVAQQLNVTFVVMSATLPKISKLILDSDSSSKDNFVHLVRNRNDYYQNPNFRERTSFRFDYLDEQLSWGELALIVNQHSERYYDENGRVKTIIECVTKISAHRLFEVIEGLPQFQDYRKLILSGTVLEPRRQDIVSFLKSQAANEGKIILVTTQVIEAGMDIDMDLGFKDTSILDAEEQFAGRINRNASKPHADLFLFNSCDSTQTYRADLRHKQRLEPAAYKEILLSKDFDRFYDLVLDNINRSNTDQFMAGNAAEFQTRIRMLHFQDVSKHFRLIRDNTVSVFVPLTLEKRHFTEEELNLLNGLGVHFVGDVMVEGDKVWSAYSSLIENKLFDFVDKKINLKMMASILAKYTFSMWDNPRQVNNLRIYTDTAEPKYGFYYLEGFANIYSYENGLKADIETDSNFY